VESVRSEFSFHSLPTGRTIAGSAFSVSGCRKIEKAMADGASGGERPRPESEHGISRPAVRFPESLDWI